MNPGSITHLRIAAARSAAHRLTINTADREHRFAQDRLSAYLDGELPQRAACRVNRHIAICSQCKRELDQLRCVVGALRRMRALGRSDPVIDTLITRVCRETELRSVDDSRPPPNRTFHRYEKASGDTVERHTV